MPAPKWAVGMQKLAAGFYLQPTGELHFDPFDFCRENNVEPNPANVAAAIEGAKLAFADTFGPDIPIEHVD